MTTWSNRFSKVLLAALVSTTLLFVQCSSDDDGNVVSPDYPEEAVISQKVDTAPAEDATVDALWSDVAGIIIPTKVPAYDIGDPDIWWNEYEGKTMHVTMKSVYTENDIYFLFQWNDAEDSKTRQAWYYHQDSTEWLQMGKKHPDKFGNDPAYEDKFTMFWNLSISDFQTNGCSNLCHGDEMKTNVAGERADIWHWKRDRTGPVSQVDDKYLDPTGRHGDDGESAYSYNAQDLVTSTGDTVAAPLYWIPDRTDYHWILKSEVDDGTAKEIVDLDSTGNFIDEVGNVLNKADFGYTSNKVISSLYNIKPGTGSRGDISAWHDWSNNTWTLKVKRARDTGNDDDVQFTEVGEVNSYWFSIGVMDAAAIAHATPGGWAGPPYQMILAE